MNKTIITLLAAMHIALAAFAVSVTLSSCSKKTPETKLSTDTIEIKQALDSMAIEMRAPELALSIDEIVLAQNGEHPIQIAQRDACEPFCLKRTIGSSPSYRADIGVVLDYIALYGSTVDQTDPRDVNGDNSITMIDFLTIVGSFGSNFDTVPLSQVETIGGEVSGSGELAQFSGDVLVDGDPVVIISLFPNSNCTVQDWSADPFDPETCYDHTMLTFSTNVGTIKYFHIN